MLPPFNPFESDQLYLRCLIPLSLFKTSHPTRPLRYLWLLHLVQLPLIRLRVGTTRPLPALVFNRTGKKEEEQTRERAFLEPLQLFTETVKR